MRATALKASGDWQGYQRLYDFGRFVRPFALTTAADGGLSDFNQGLLAKLERLHTQNNIRCSSRYAVVLKPTASYFLIKMKIFKR